MSHMKANQGRRESSGFGYEQFSGYSSNQPNGRASTSQGSPAPYSSPSEPTRPNRESVRRASRIDFINPSLQQTLNASFPAATAPRPSAAALENIKQPWTRELMKKRLKRIMDSFLFQLFVTIFTLWALFSDDIRLSSTEKNADVVFETIISIIFFFFLIEIIGKLFCEEKYFHIPKKKKPDIEESLYDRWYRRLRIGSFYFFIDFISTMSLLIEVWYLIQAQLRCH
jgi:hypothetical protein